MDAPKCMSELFLHRSLRGVMFEEFRSNVGVSVPKPVGRTIIQWTALGQFIISSWRVVFSIARPVAQHFEVACARHNFRQLALAAAGKESDRFSVRGIVGGEVSVGARLAVVLFLGTLVRCFVFQARRWFSPLCCDASWPTVLLLSPCFNMSGVMPQSRASVEQLSKRHQNVPLVRSDARGMGALHHSMEARGSQCRFDPPSDRARAAVGTDTTGVVSSTCSSL